MLAAELLLGLLHDLQELLEGNAAIARDISLVDDLIDIVLLLLFKGKKGKGMISIVAQLIYRSLLHLFFIILLVPFLSFSIELL